MIMAQSAKVRVLVRNLESSSEILNFSNFTLRRLGLDYAAAREFFPEAMQEEWLLERNYAAIPPLPSSAEGWPAPLGGIPFDVEDTLLLLRLYRTGDLAFVSLNIQAPSSSLRQFPHRAISPLVSNGSLQPFKFSEVDCSPWERFATELRASPQWNSPWFRVVRRCLLYAGGKEFNPNFEDDIDRVIDYMTALEATLIPKQTRSISQCIQERGVKLLGLSLSASDDARTCLKTMYDIRSTLIHGTAVKPTQIAFLRSTDWNKCEQLLRDILVAALRNVPSQQQDRTVYLNRLFKP